MLNARIILDSLQFYVYKTQITTPHAYFIDAPHRFLQSKTVPRALCCRSAVSSSTFQNYNQLRIFPPPGARSPLAPRSPAPLSPSAGTRLLLAWRRRFVESEPALTFSFHPTNFSVLSRKHESNLGPRASRF